jgi:enolase
MTTEDKKRKGEEEMTDTTNNFSVELFRVLRDLDTGNYWGEKGVEDAMEAIKQAVEQYIIGEDDKYYIEIGQVIFNRNVGANELRAEQRQALNLSIGEK